MFENIFLTFILPIVSGFSVAIIATWLLERLGGVVGGILATTPHLIVVGTAFILAYANTPEDALIGIYSSIISILLDVMYLHCWKYIPEYFSHINVYCLLFISLIIWFICAFICYLLISTYLVSASIIVYQILAIGITIILIIIGIIGNIKHYESPKGSNRVSLKTHLIRGCGAGIIVLVVSLSAELNHTIIAGLFNSFPVMFTVSMTSLWITQGKAVSLGAISPMILGLMSLNVFTLGVGTFVQYIFKTKKQYMKNMELILFSSWIAAILVISIPTFVLIRFLRSRIISKESQKELAIAVTPPMRHTSANTDNPSVQNAAGNNNNNDPPLSAETAL